MPMYEEEAKRTSIGQRADVEKIAIDQWMI
jgi:hypothetical protein